jgi:hypothetical protein
MMPNFYPVFVMAVIGVGAMPLAIWKLIDIAMWLLS